LALKETDMDKAVRAARRLQKHLNNEPFTDEEKDEETAMQLEIQYEGTLYKERAFADHEDKDRMRAVADYSDRWFALDSGMGFFNVYYVCKAGAALWPCNTLIISQEWDRLHQDMTATKQRWYCKECTAKYKVKYGVMVEITIDSRAFYAVAELPPWDIQDAKLMKIAEDYEQYKTPEELLAALPKIMPLDKKQFLMPTKNRATSSSTQTCSRTSPNSSGARCTTSVALRTSPATVSRGKSLMILVMSVEHFFSSVRLNER
jgi:hypothetical protein